MEISVVDKFVIKHSAAVQISNKISLLQRRAWNILLANAYNFLLDKDDFCIDLKSFVKLIGYQNSHNDAHLKELLGNLVTTKIEWNLLGKDKKKVWEVMTLLSSAKITDGKIYYSYSSSLAKKLYNPNVFARVSLSMQNKFNSKYSLAIYELCIDYFIAKRNYGYTPIIPLDIFRNLMGLEDGKYKNFKDLNKYVVRSSIDEINEKADIQVTVEYHKSNRTVVGLSFSIDAGELFDKFSVFDNPENELNSLMDNEVKVAIMEEENINDELLNKIKNCGLTHEQAMDILKNQDEETILNHLQYINSQKNIINKGAYSKKVFDKREIPVKDLKKEEELLKKKQKETEEHLKIMYDDFINQNILEYTQSLSDEEQQRIRVECEKIAKEKCKDNLSQNKKVAEFLLNASTDVEVDLYIKQKLKLPEFEKWVKNRVKSNDKKVN